VLDEVHNILTPSKAFDKLANFSLDWWNVHSTNLSNTYQVIYPILSNPLPKFIFPFFLLLPKNTNQVAQ
jgi:hypothetical protein